MALSVQILRRYAVGRSLFAPTTLARAVERLGFIQADPIRAPARAQDLILRPRVKGYRAGDLERRYPELELEEDCFINYGFLHRRAHALSHPRRLGVKGSTRRAQALLDFVRARGATHPRDADAHFAHGRVINAWGGTSNATTRMLDQLHYRGLLRVVGRTNGIRLYGPADWSQRPPTASLDALVDVGVNTYAPLTATGLGALVTRLRHAAPQLAAGRKAALARARERLSHARLDGVDWYWPAGERPQDFEPLEDALRLLAPFDPVVWDRPRFERLWGWAYRFEAYTPVARRKLGYYALPLLWRDAVIGWGNVSFANGELTADLGFVAGARPKDPAFRRALEAELEAMRLFL